LAGFLFGIGFNLDYEGSLHLGAWYVKRIVPQFPPREYVPDREYRYDFAGGRIFKGFSSRYVTDQDATKPLPAKAFAAPPQPNQGEYFLEWMDVAAAINSAKDHFIMAELGGGTGARTVNAANAIRQLRPALRSSFTVVEAMPTHIPYIEKNIQDNGVDRSRVNVVNGAVWIDDVPNFFPVATGIFGQAVSDGAISRAVERLSPDAAKIALKNLVTTGRLGIEEPFKSRIGTQTRDWAVVNSVTIPTLFHAYQRVDLIDWDIQGAERTVIPQNIDFLQKRVKLMHIGTHGADTHRELYELLSERGWTIRASLAPLMQHQTEYGAFETNDGVLSALNDRLD
jgi:hypothetical protein